MILWENLIYAKFVGKEIPESYFPALYEYDLMLSRYLQDVKDKHDLVKFES